MTTPPISIAISGDNNDRDLILSSASGAIVEHGDHTMEDEHSLPLTKINALEGSFNFSCSKRCFRCCGKCF